MTPKSCEKPRIYRHHGRWYVTGPSGHGRWRLTSRPCHSIHEAWAAYRVALGYLN